MLWRRKSRGGKGKLHWLTASEAECTAYREALLAVRGELELITSPETSMQRGDMEHLTNAMVMINRALGD